MIDLEREVRELLREKASEGSVPTHPSGPMLRRVRRRQLGTVVGASLTSVLLLVGSIAGMQALFRRPSTTIGGATPAEPRTAVLQHATITYPSNWYLLVVNDDTFQLTNFDPAFTQPCFTGDAVQLPSDGVLLSVQRGTGPSGTGADTWPTNLADDPAPSACRPGGLEENAPSEPAHLSAEWAVDDGTVPYTANAMIGPDATEPDRGTLDAAFASITFAKGDASQTSDILGTPSLVLDSADSTIGPVLLYATEDQQGPWLGVAGPANTGLSGKGTVGTEPPFGPGDLLRLGAKDSSIDVVLGVVTDEAASAEIRTGPPSPARLAPLPPSLHVSGGQAVWGFIDASTPQGVPPVDLFDTGHSLLGISTTGPSETIASGNDPEGGPWTLYITHSSDGEGLGFGWANGSSGSGCCLHPLGNSDLKLDGYGTSSSDPSDVTAFASTRVASVDLVLHAAGGYPGGTYHGQLFAMPAQYMEAAHVVLVLVPQGIPLHGDLIAYGADGSELARAAVGDDQERSGPTPEIDAVWQALYKARDAVSRYFEQNDSFGSMTVDALAQIEPGVTFATSSEPNAVSVSTSDGLHAVVSSSTSSGIGYCIGVEAGHGFTYRYGTMFATSYDACRGGWS
jgi:hypothetical protein